MPWGKQQAKEFQLLQRSASCISGSAGLVSAAFWVMQCLMRTKNLPSDKLQLKTGDPTELNHCDILFHCLCKHVSKGSYAHLSAVFRLQFQVNIKKKYWFLKPQVFITTANKHPMIYILTLSHMSLGPDRSILQFQLCASKWDFVSND